MASGEISKTLPAFPAEQGWVPSSISIALAQPVLAVGFFCFDSKNLLSRWEKTSHEE
jgi:hypothetical protein